MSGEEMETSGESFTSCLDVFRLPPTESLVEKKKYIEYRPLTQVTEGAPIEFVIAASQGQYIDLKNSFLSLKARIVDKNGQALAVGKLASPINLIFQSLFQQVDVSLQGNKITQTGVNFAHEAYLDTLLHANADQANGKLQSEGFFLDTSAFMDEASPLSTNGGLTQRYALFQQGRWVELLGQLRVDFFQQEKYLLDNVDMGLRLWLNKPDFYLMTPETDEGYRLQLTDVIFHICKVNVVPQIIEAHADVLQTITAKYPYLKRDSKRYSLLRGENSFAFEDIFQGRVPQKITIALVKSVAYNGDYQQNPFNFIHQQLEQLTVTVNDDPTPFRTLNTNFAQKQYLQGYRTLYMSDDTSPALIPRRDYPAGYSIFHLPLQAVYDPQNFPRQQAGSLKIQGHFESALPENTDVLIIGEFPRVLHVDASRNVFLHS